MAAEKGRKPEEIFQGFQNLRNEQRKLATKISEMEMDLNEHKIVVEALSHVDGERKCFRLINGILVQRTVKEVHPGLTSQRDQLEEAIKSLNETLVKKGVEMNEYKEKYNIRIRGADIEQEDVEAPSSTPQTTGVLVDKA